MQKLFFQLLPTIKKIGTWIIYIVFALYILYISSAATKVSAKIFFLIIGIIVLSIVVLFEFLKNIYSKMIYALTMDCDLSEAKIQKDKLIKYDIFKGFKNSLLLFDALLLLDEGMYNDCLLHIKNNQKFFHSTLDYMLIAHRTNLQCAYFLEDKTLFDNSLKNIYRLKENSSKKAKVNPLYSWEEIRGLEYFRNQRFSKSLEEFYKVDIQRLNKREETYLLFEIAQTERKLNHLSKSNQLLKEVKNKGKSLHITKLAEEKEVITFEKL